MQTPTEVLAARLANIEAELQLASEREFYLLAELRRAEAELIGAGLRADVVPHMPPDRA